MGSPMVILPLCQDIKCRGSGWVEEGRWGDREKTVKTWYWVFDQQRPSSWLLLAGRRSMIELGSWDLIMWDEIWYLSSHVPGAPTLANSPVMFPSLPDVMLAPANVLTFIFNNLKMGMRPAEQNMETCGAKCRKKGEYFGQDWICFPKLKAGSIFCIPSSVWRLEVEMVRWTKHILSQPTEPTLLGSSSLCDDILLCQVHFSSHTWTLYTLRSCGQSNKYFYTNISELIIRPINHF